MAISRWFCNRGPILWGARLLRVRSLSLPPRPLILREIKRIPYGRLRPRHYRRRHQRNRIGQGRRRPRAARAAGGAKRSCLRHVLGFQQADPRWLALSRAWRLSPGARGAERARSVAAPGAARDPAAAFAAATGSQFAFAVAAAVGFVHL